jgi:DMSO/TMAO reductase YedYZ molybdopterin-dependent catalytic subunit
MQPPFDATPPLSRRVWLARSTGLALVTGLGIAHAAGEVVVGGDVKQGVTLDAGALRAFPAGAHVNFRSSVDMSGQDRPFSVLRGVRLTSVLELVGLAARERFDSRKTVVIASGQDGYRVAFSWPELANTQTGDQAMVAYERDGVPLRAPEGPLWLFVPGDTPSGSRDVKQLQRIEVRILRE